MTTSTQIRFDLMPSDEVIAGAAESLEQRGFAVHVVDDTDSARALVIGTIPESSSVMTNTSITLDEAGISSAINEGGEFDSIRKQLGELDFETQARDMKILANQPDFALGSVQAVTKDGVLVLASFSGSQLASYVWGAANVIFVVGAQKIVPDLDSARQRIYEHALPLEDARAFAAYGMNSRVRKILEIHEEDPGRIHVVLVRQAIGF
jgi:acyl-CoA hydrolase